MTLLSGNTAPDHDGRTPEGNSLFMQENKQRVGVEFVRGKVRKKNRWTFCLSTKKTTMLKAIHIKEFHSYKDTTFEWKDKNSLAFVGNNGSGKSLAIKAILKVFSPYAPITSPFDISLTFDVQEDRQELLQVVKKHKRSSQNVDSVNESEVESLLREKLSNLTIRRFSAEEPYRGEVKFQFEDGSQELWYDSPSLRNSQSNLMSYLSHVEGHLSELFVKMFSKRVRIVREHRGLLFEPWKGHPNFSKSERGLTLDNVALNFEEVAQLCFKLKNGIYDERKRYLKMQQEYKTITGVEFDVVSCAIPDKVTRGNSSEEKTPLDNRHSNQYPTSDNPKIEVRLVFGFDNGPQDLLVNDLAGGYVDTLIAVVALYSANVTTLILDEIGRGLYPHQRVQLRSLLLSKKHLSILYTTHNPEMVEPGRQSIYHLTSQKNCIQATALHDINWTNKENAVFGSLSTRLLLFSKNVIFVEGPDDQILLQTLNQCLINGDYKEQWKNYKEIRATIMYMGGHRDTCKMMKLAKSLNINAVAIVDKDAMVKKGDPNPPSQVDSIDLFLRQTSEKDPKKLLQEYDRWKPSTNPSVYLYGQTLKAVPTLVGQQDQNNWDTKVCEVHDTNKRENQILRFYEDHNIFGWKAGALEEVILLTDSKNFKNKGLASNYSHDQIEGLVQKMESIPKGGNRDMNRMLKFLSKHKMIYPDDEQQKPYTIEEDEN